MFFAWIFSIFGFANFTYGGLLVCVCAFRIKPYKKLFSKVLILLWFYAEKSLCCACVRNCYYYQHIRCYRETSKWKKRTNCDKPCMGYLKGPVRQILFLFFDVHTQCSRPPMSQTRWNRVLSIWQDIESKCRKLDQWCIKAKSFCLSSDVACRIHHVLYHPEHFLRTQTRRAEERGNEWQIFDSRKRFCSN